MSDITNAIKQICEEKNLSYEAVLETIESALAAAYRKDFGEKNQNIKVEFDPETGKSKIYDVKTVVEDLPEEAESVDDLVEQKLIVEEKKTESKKEEVRRKKGKKDEAVNVETVAVGGQAEVAEGKAETSLTPPVMNTGQALLKGGKDGLTPPNPPLEGGQAEGGQEEEVRKFNPKTELQIKDAVLIKKTAKIDDVIKTKLAVPDAYGRMAAQTAKQVIIQKLREAEREMVFSEFKNKEHEVVAGVIQRREGNVVLIDLGKAVGVLPSEEQIMGERYCPGDRVKVYVKYVGTTNRGPEIILSRTSDEILKKVFYLEIPEIANGLVEIKAVAREAGNRSKVAVFAAGENVDPIGSCVGQRGARIQTIISELGGEKIDIIEYDEDVAKFIAHALAPAKVISVELNTAEKRAVAKVHEDQLSLAIGREGQNVRLAARLTEWKIDIVGEKQESEKTKRPGNNKAEKKAETEKAAVEAGEEKKAEVKVEAEKPAAEAVIEKNEDAEIEAKPFEPKVEPAVESKKKKSKKTKVEVGEVKISK